MNAYEKLEALLAACHSAGGNWERQKLLADFYSTGMLDEVVKELAPKKRGRKAQ